MRSPSPYDTLALFIISFISIFLSPPVVSRPKGTLAHKLVDIDANMFRRILSFLIADVKIYLKSL